MSASRRGRPEPSWRTAPSEDEPWHRPNPVRYPKGAVEELLHSALLAGEDVPEILRTLDELSDMEAGADVLLESLQAAQRAEAHAAALKAHYAARLAKADLHKYADRDGVINVLAEQVGMTLGTTRAAAERLVRTGVVTESLLLATGAAMRSGTLTADKGWILVDALGDLVPAVALAVEEVVLPTAPERTPTELRRDIARALAEIDPEDADARHLVARDRRHVSRPQPLPDSMARISVFLPADQAVTLDAALTEIARTAHAAGDARTLCHLRVDALADWAATVTQDGWDITSLTGTPNRTAPTRVNVTVPLEVLAHAVPDFTPPPTVGAVMYRDLHGDLSDQSGEPEGGPAAGHRTEAPWLEGYGPVTRFVALLLAAGGTWRRLVTDTVTGAPLEIGRERYSPPAHIAEAVRLRDRVCTRPGCSAPARHCELDHVTPWALGGETSAANLACACRRCHRIHTVGGGGPGPLKPDGSRDWHTATGHTYRGHPERAPRQRGGPAPGTPPPADDPPPF